MNIMDDLQIIRDYVELKEKDFLKQLKKEKILYIDLTEFIELIGSKSEDLIDAPETLLYNIRNIVSDRFKKIKDIRLTNIPEVHKLQIRELRAKHQGKLVSFSGTIKQVTEVNHMVTSINFECPNCGSIIKIIQKDDTVQIPSGCSCGKRGQFKELSKDLTDYQVMTIEETHEHLEGDAQPQKVNIISLGSLCDTEKVQKNVPGTIVNVTGILKEQKKQTRFGVSTKLGKYVEVNNITTRDEDEFNLNITEEEKELIYETAKNSKAFDIISNSVAPSVYGYKDIKQALTLQLFGGVRHQRADKTDTRDNIHGLLVGDPGCCRKDTYVTLSDGTFKQIGDFGEHHHQKINQDILIDNNNIEKANLFWKFEQHETKRIRLSNGKLLVCSLIHPLLVKHENDNEWVKAKDLKIGDKVKIVTNIKSDKTDYVMHMDRVINEDIALAFGILIGDGYTRTNGYRVGISVTDKKIEVIKKLEDIIKTQFDKRLIINRVKRKDSKLNGRMIIHKQILNDCVINSKQLCSFFKMEKSKYKRVPKCIMASKDSVISNFLKGLFSTDGSCYITNPKDRTQKININYKSSSEWLLQDIQLLLTRFGIQSRIHGNGLTIRRYEDILLFRKHIGFIQKDKNDKLKLAEKYQPSKIKSINSYERIVSIADDEIQDVFDITVKNAHQYISNGIISHNTAKSVILRFMANLTRRGRFVSGKGASGVGLTASVVKSDISGGWVLQAGPLIMANGSVCSIDEGDKMTEEDRSNLHEAMSIGTLTISKANIHATLPARTSVLMAANPKRGRFNHQMNLIDQINLVPSLLSRFDFVYVMKDKPHEDTDRDIANKILGETMSLYDTETLNVEFLRKYIFLSKQINPALSVEARQAIADFYVNLRKQTKSTDDGEMMIPITARQLESIIRFAEAHARLKFRKIVGIEDAKIAIKMVQDYLTEFGYNSEEGGFDIDKIMGTSTSQRKRVEFIKHIITQLQPQYENNIAPIEAIEERANSITERQLDEALSTLSRSGEILRVNRGYKIC